MSAPAPDAEHLAGLVFELASQLHAERARRRALEAALDAAGLLKPETIEAAAADPAFRKAAYAEADASVLKLMRVLTDSPDPKTPLRPAEETAR